MRTLRTSAPPAFLFFGVFTGNPELFAPVRERIVAAWGPLHPRGESPVYPFPQTRTYAESMGRNLLRRFYILEALWPQDRLAEVKRRTIQIEEAIRAEHPTGVQRPVNVDPGLLNDCRILLASTKDFSHRIYRGDGIWEEVTLIFERGSYRPLPWTYPDFRAPTYYDFFEGFRRELLERVRGSGPCGGQQHDTPSPGTP